MANAAIYAAAVCTAVLGCSDVVEQSDISYDDRFALTRMDVYSPPPAATPRPAVIVIHGGGWREPLRRDGMADHAHRLADAGYVAFNIDYRLVGDGGQFPHAVQDCICALAYVRAHAADYAIDPARVAAFGYSAGVHLVSMLGVATAEPMVQPDCASGATGPVQAVVSGAGPEDMTLLPQLYPVTDFMGGTKEAVPDLYAAASPITHVAAGAPPYLFVDGDNDWFVDIEHAYKMRDALDGVGAETRMFEIPGGGHIWNRGADGGSWDLEMSIDTPEAWAATIDFLDHTIGPVP